MDNIGFAGVVVVNLLTSQGVKVNFVPPFTEGFVKGPSAMLLKREEMKNRRTINFVNSGLKGQIHEVFDLIFILSTVTLHGLL